jgi:hypothetical protein
MRELGRVRLHLFPSIRAIVINRNSLPLFPLTPVLNFFKRYMNKRASITTFWPTCVVDRILVTHFWNPAEGTVSGPSEAYSFRQPSMVASLAELSNQNRQVIWRRESALRVSPRRQASLPGLQIQPSPLCCCEPRRESADRQLRSCWAHSSGARGRKPESSRSKRSWVGA